MQGLQAGSYPLLTQDSFHWLLVQTEVHNSSHRNIYNLNVKFTRTSRKRAGACISGDPPLCRPHHLGAAAHACCISPAARLLVHVLDQLRVRPLDDGGDGGQQMKTEGTRHVLAGTAAGMLAEQVDERHGLGPQAPVRLEDKRRKAHAVQLDEEGKVAFLVRLASLGGVEGVAGRTVDVRRGAWIDAADVDGVDGRR